MKKVMFVATVATHIKGFHEPYLKLLHDNDYMTYVACNNNLCKSNSIKNCDVFIEIPIERSPYKLKNITAIKELKKIIEKEKFDIIHCHTPMGAVVARLAARKARKKYGTRVIYTAHGFHFYKGAPLKNWILFFSVEWFLAKYTDTLITINKEDYELAKKKFSKRCKDIQYVPGVGIDTEKFNIELSEEERDKLRESLGLKKDDFVLTCVARLDRNKNQVFLIGCMKELVQKYNNIHLLLVGNDEIDGRYQTITKELNLDGNIHFLGRREDVPQILQITNIVVSASRREGLPVNIIEALSSGVPIIALNCRGMKDLLDNTNNIIIDTKNSKEQLEMFKKSILNYYFSDDKKIDTIKRDNINISQQYDLKEVVKQYDKIYSKKYNKTNVLHILASNSFSGAENVVCTIIKNFNTEYNMFYCSPFGQISDKLKEENIKYYPLKRLSLFELRKIIKEVHPDIIHAHDNKATVLCSFFSKKCKVISHIHGNNRIMNKLNYKTLLFNWCSKKIEKFIWVSDSSFNDYYFKNTVSNKSVILYNVIDQNYIVEKSNCYNPKVSYDLIFLGRLAYPKDPARFIEIVKLLKKSKKNISVAMAGDGNQKREIENLIEKYDLKQNITLYGFLSNPYPILKNSKVLVMTSIYEGTPMCALEAQALGKPIVATPVDGLKKIVINGYNGFLSEDNVILSEKIMSILEKDYVTFRNNSLNRFNKINSISNYMKKIQEIYDEGE